MKGNLNGGNKWVRFKKEVADFLFPMGTYCVICGNIIDSSRSYCLCDHCIEHIRWGNIQVDLQAESHHTGRASFLDSVTACIKYGLYERRLIFDLKYNGHTYVARVIAEILCDRVATDPGASRLLHTAYVVPVPLHKKKERVRGFNQTEKIGKHFIKGLRERMTLGELALQSGDTSSDAKGSPAPKLLTGALLRIKETTAQRSLSAQERFDNLEAAFCVDKNAEKLIKGRSLILLDDVYTTGSTANHCAKVLKEAGAAEVHLLVLATGNDFAEGHFEEEA